MTAAALTVGVIQTTTGIDPAANARELTAAIARVAADGAAIAFTPEMSNLLDRNGERLRRNVRPEEQDETLAAVRQAAQTHAMPVAIGSLAILRADGKLANRSYVIGADGAIVARYDKMHLFDVDLPGGERYRESATFTAGDAATIADLPLGRLGLSICYDVRFPALYAALAQAGASLIAVPAAFTVPTGEAHWHVLLRARAIETGAFVIAAAQCGTHADGRRTFGHSLVIDPWGQVLADLGDQPGEAVVSLDVSQVAASRAKVPNLRHIRLIAALA